MFLETLGVGLLTLIVSCVHWYTQGLRHVRYMPGYRLLLEPYSLAGAIIPRSFWNFGANWAWIDRKTSFFNHSHDIISIVPVLAGSAGYYTCSLDVLKQLLGNEGKIPLVKPLDLTLHRLWGDSVAASSGDIWKKHRRVVAPAFNTKTFANVRSETLSIYQQILEVEGWNNKNEVIIPIVNTFALKFSLMVIARCGFGIPMSWISTHNTPTGKDLSYEQAIHTVCETLIPRLVIPQWAYKLPIKALSDIERVWSHFTSSTKEYIRDSRADIQGREDDQGSADILRRLVLSSNDGAGKYNLSEDEVIANMFTLMFAGHETTASVLAATLALLSIHKEEEEKAYREVVNHNSNSGRPDIEEPNMLPHLLSCFIEAGRMFPAAFLLPRTMTEDTAVKVQRPKEEIVILPKGSRITFELVGTFYNPHTFPDPLKYNPSRWYGISELDIPIFGAGPRACVGKKLALTEAINFLAILLKDWKLDIVPELVLQGNWKEKDPGDILKEYAEKVMGNAGPSGTAFAIAPVPVKLLRRHHT